MLSFSKLAAKSSPIQLQAGQANTDRAPTALWTQTGTGTVTLTVNATPGPDNRSGSVQAAKMVEGNTLASYALDSTAGQWTGTAAQYRHRLYVKQWGPSPRWFRFGFIDNGFTTWGEMTINLASGENAISGGLPMTNTLLQVARPGNGWFRIDFSGTETADGWFPYVNLGDTQANAAGKLAYQGDGLSGALVWGLDVRLAAGATG